MAELDEFFLKKSSKRTKKNAAASKAAPQPETPKVDAKPSTSTSSPHVSGKSSAANADETSPEAREEEVEDTTPAADRASSDMPEAVVEEAEADDGDGPTEQSPVLPDESLQDALPMEFVVATRDAVEVRAVMPGQVSDEPKLIISLPAVQVADNLAWSPDGRWLGILGSRTLQVLAADREYEVLHEVHPKGRGIKSFAFSVRGTFVVTFEAMGSAGEAQDGPENNLWVWRLQDDAAEVVGCFHHDRPWPALKWTGEEEFCCRLHKGELQVFPGEDVSGGSVLGTVCSEGVVSFEMTPKGAKPCVAIFISSRKGVKPRCEVHSLEAVDGQSTAQAEFKLEDDADSARLLWNSDGTALLILASTDVDSTGKSYFGNSSLGYLRADGSHGAILVPSKDGPVRDVAWCPNEDEFMLLHGDWPCKMTLYGGPQAKLLLDFGKGHRNTIEWGPLGRMFAIGGFGQLPGDVDIFDRQSRNRVTKLRYECCVSFKWSPDGRIFLGSTTAPRMRVDNRIELYKYDGKRQLRVDYGELYLAAWRPMPASSFADIPDDLAAAAGTGSDTLESNSKVGTYAPPKGSGKLAQRLRAVHEDGVRDTAMTAEAAAAEQKQLAAEKRANRAAGGKDKKTRDVPVPADLVGAIIGAKGAAIRELANSVGSHLEVVNAPHSVTGGTPQQKSSKEDKSNNNGDKEKDQGQPSVRISQSGPWDDLDKAEALILKRVEELREQRDRDQQRKQRKVPIPDSLVSKFIGAQGASIQELSKQVGLTLKVRQGKEGQVVLIDAAMVLGSATPLDVEEAERLVLDKVEQLEAEAQARDAARAERDAQGEGWWKSGWKDNNSWESSKSSTWWSKEGWWNSKDWGDSSQDWSTWREDKRDEDDDADNQRDPATDSIGSAEAVEASKEVPAQPVRGPTGVWAKPSRLDFSTRGPANATKAPEPWSQGAPKEDKATRGRKEGAASQEAPGSDAAAEHRAQGEAALKDGRGAEALQFFVNARKATPNQRDARSLLGQCRARLQLEDFREALRDAHALVKLQPNWADGHLCKGKAFKALGQMVEAEACFEEALAKDPNHREAKRSLRELQAPKDRWAEQEEEEEVPKKGSGDHPGHRKKKARPHYSRDDRKCMECDKVQPFGAIDTSNDQWYCKVCWSSWLDISSSDDEPEPQAEASHRSDKKKNGKAAVASDAGERNRPRYDESTAAADRERIKAPSSSSTQKPPSAAEDEAAALRQQGEEALKRGDAEAALDAFHKAAKKNSRDPRCLVGRSAARLHVGDVNGAYQDASTAARLDPTMAIAHYRKGQAAKALGEEEKAELALQEARRLQPDICETEEALRPIASAPAGAGKGAAASSSSCSSQQKQPQQQWQQPRPSAGRPSQKAEAAARAGASEPKGGASGPPAAPSGGDMREEAEEELGAEAALGSSPTAASSSKKPRIVWSEEPVLDEEDFIDIDQRTSPGGGPAPRHSPAGGAAMYSERPRETEDRWAALRSEGGGFDGRGRDGRAGGGKGGRFGGGKSSPPSWDGKRGSGGSPSSGGKSAGRSQRDRPRPGGGKGKDWR